MANTARNVSGNKLNKNAYIAMLALENYGYTGDYTLTSMYRGSKLNKSVGGKSDSLHLHGNAIDVGVQAGDSKELAKWIKTKAGKKWLKDFNIYYEDETSGSAPHHHFGFKDVTDTSVIKNYNHYEEAYEENKNSNNEFVTINTDDVDGSLKWSIVSTDINLPLTEEDLEKDKKKDEVVQEQDMLGLIPEITIEETKEESASDYQTQVYDTKDKKWYKITVDYNDGGTDGDVRIYDESGKEIDHKSKNKEEIEIYQSIKKQVIVDNLSGENNFKKGTSDGSVYYTSYEGHGRYQITTPPIIKTKPPEDLVIASEEISVEKKKKSEKDYQKDIVDRVSGREEYLKYKEDNKELYKELSILEKNLPLLDVGSKNYTRSLNRYNELKKQLQDQETQLKENLYNSELKNYVNAENNSRQNLSRLQNEIKSYINNNEEPPQELKDQIEKARKEILTNGNRVKLLVKGGWENYDISPIQRGHHQNIINTDGSINTEASEAAVEGRNILGGDEEVVVVEEAVVEEEVVEEEVVDDGISTLTRGQQLMKGGESLLKGAGKVLDYIGGPGAIISYIMGKKGLKEAMKEVKPQASAKLSPLFMQHLRQTRELSKKGFHPDETRLIRKEIDGAYQKGLENAVRGSGGQRATFLAQSGVLDSQRSSALLDYAAKDADLQRKNAEKYEKMMLFKENFDIQRTEKERAEDMERQVANKKAAAGFTSAAFTNLISGFGGSSLTNQYSGSNPFFNQIQDVLNRSGETGTNE